MTVTRRVVNTFAPLVTPDGEVYANKPVTFQLVKADTQRPISLFDAVNGDYIVGDIITTSTNGLGEFAQELWPNTRGGEATYYLVSTPDSALKPFLIRVTDAVGDMVLAEAAAGVSGTPTPEQVGLFEALLASISEQVAQATAVVTTTANGLMSYVDKIRLDTIWAQVSSLWSDTSVVRTSDGLAAAVTAAGGNRRTIKFTVDQTLAGSLTVPANVELVPLNGAKINRGVYTFTCLGSTSRWPDAQVLEGTGTVTFDETNTPVVNPLWWGSVADADAGTQFIGPPTGSGAHFVGYRGGYSGTPRVYVMPSGTGEANVKSAVKVFSADYYAELLKASPTYEDIGIYYSATDGSFNINSKATRKGVVSNIAAKPINLMFNDSTSNLAASFFMQSIKGATKTITGITSGASAVVTSAGHGFTAPAWVYIDGIVGTMSALNGAWHLVSAVTTDTFTIDFDSTGLAYTSGGTAQLLTNSPKPCTLVGPSFASVTQFDSVGMYVNTDAAVLYEKMWRFYETGNASAGHGFKMNGTKLDIYNSSSVVASVTSFGVVNAPASVPTIASATTITPSALIIKVSGTTAIATINLPFTGFIGSITIIPTGTFSTNTAGNIALASSAVVNKALTLTYDGTKWYPSY